MRYAALLVSLTAALPAQDVLHYKFDSGCGTEVVNFAEGSKVGPARMVSTLPGAPASSWVAGKWRTGMSGSIKTSPTSDNHLVTNWNIGTFTGSFSISMWLRNKSGNPSTIQFGYLFGATGSSFRCFTGLSGKLFVGSWGGTPSNLVNATNLTTLLNSGYVHVALVVDDKNKKATYYINGKADPAITLTGSVRFSGTNFTLGKYSRSSGCPLDFDEFLFTRRALTATEVTQLFRSQQAGAGVFGTKNQGTLRHGNGRPKLGNLLFRMTINDPQGTRFLLYVGSNRCSLLGGPKLPLDLGKIIPAFAGTTAYTDIDIFTFAGSMTGGSATLGMPIPNLTPLIGYGTYWQAYTITAQNKLRGTNGLAVTPGF